MSTRCPRHAACAACGVPSWRWRPSWRWAESSPTSRSSRCATATVSTAAWSSARRSSTTRHRVRRRRAPDLGRAGQARRDRAGGDRRATRLPGRLGRAGHLVHLARRHRRRVGQARTGSTSRCRHRRRAVLALAELLEALTRAGPRHHAQRARMSRSTARSSPTWRELVDAAGELQEQPPDGVRVGHGDLGLWDELAEIGVVDEQAAHWVRRRSTAQRRGAPAGGACRGQG